MNCEVFRTRSAKVGVGEAGILNCRASDKETRAIASPLKPSESALGAVACGHPCTAAAAAEILAEGGTAFDALVAAQLTACVAEPVLASLGGGGYALVHPANRSPRVYDFFAQTPLRRANPEVDDFQPINADFGTTTQQFHIGTGSAAVPGMVAGVFQMHRDLGTLPLRRLAEPAIRAARDGVELSPFHEYLFGVVAPIYLHSEGVRATYAPTGDLPRVGTRLVQSDLADTLSALAAEGPGLFYTGEIGQRLATLCADGGTLSLDDLGRYEVHVSVPLSVRYRGATLYTNPPPASGGLLISFALQLLEHLPIGSLDETARLDALVSVMALTQQARTEADVDGYPDLLDPERIKRYRDELVQRPACFRGTTHISVIDAAGNLAASTLSNGEGCGHLIPGTGIMLNNMLGEDDINPEGFQAWQPNVRMTSMMAPSLLELDDARRVVLGSGGSNRIRTAILQVISNIVDFGMAIDEAVVKPRLHIDADTLSLEPGLPVPDSADSLVIEQWNELNLFFGGVHCAAQQAPRQGGRFAATGDPRREGVGLVVNA